MDNLIWGEYGIEISEDPHVWKIGPLRLWIRRTAQELQVAFDYENKDEAQSMPLETTAGDPLEGAGTSRWAVEEQPLSLRLGPVFPDRPVLAHPQLPFFIAKNERARIYVRLPMRVRVEFFQSDVHEIAAEIPTVILSKTWLGTFTDGEICYWIPTSARRQVKPDIFQPHLAVCPVQIVNQSDEELRVERICLRVEHLSVFSVEDRLWADETSVFFKGSDQISNVHVAGKPPSEAVGSFLLTSPGVPVEGGFAAKTFTWLKDLPGLGILS